MVMEQHPLGFLFSVISFLANNLIPIMLGGFACAFVFRVLVYITVQRQNWFVRELEKRVYRVLSHSSNDEELSFFSLMKDTMQKTYHEIFELRRQYGRRHPDRIMGLNDRVFMIQEGTARIILDFLRQARYLERDHDRPKFIEISKTVFEQNSIFGRLFGYIPVNLLNNFLNILPGLFVIGGIFGTFLGIIEGLPALGGMDVTDSIASKAVMDTFLTKISFAMNTSIVGILLSVFMTVSNTLLSPDNIYYNVINRFTSTIEIVWNKSSHNQISEEDAGFVEARDRLDMEAGEALKLAEQFKRDQFLLNNARFFPSYFQQHGPDDESDPAEDGSEGQVS